MRRVCVVVDDFGLHSGVTLAVMELAGRSLLGGVGCMVGGPEWKPGAAILKRLQPQALDIGLHLDLSQFPLTQQAIDLKRLIARSCLGLLDRARVRTEIRAQLDAFEQTLGRAPDFVDGHQHVHQLPVVRHELVDELASRYRGVEPWLRSTQRPERDGPSLVQGDFKPWLIEKLGNAGLLSLAQRHRIHHNRHLLGVYDFDADASRYACLVDGWLSVASDGDLLMCHPSARPDEADAIHEARQSEFDVLCSEWFAATLSRAGITVQPMSLILDRP